MNSNFEDSLDRLPAELDGDDYWGAVRNDHLAAMRRDAEGLPMTSSQEMLMERIATFYAILRRRESDGEERMSASEMRQSYQLWQSMTAEFNKQITIGEDKRRETMLRKILSIIENTVRSIEDPRVREDTRKRFAASFDEADL